MSFYLIKLVGRIIEYIIFKLIYKIPYIVILNNPFIYVVKTSVTFYIIRLVKNILL